MTSFTSWNLITVPWLLFMVYWAISARNVQQVKQGEPVASSLFRYTTMTLAAILLLSNWLRIGLLARRFAPDTPGVRDAGIVLAFCGVFLAIWARRHIGRYWSSNVTVKVDHKLIQSGPYARMRHPIYSGLLLAMIGTALAVGEWRGLVAVVLVLLAHWRKAKREEGVLSQEFGDEFARYRKHTGFLIPRFGKAES